jgi:hypothetical protein
MSDEEFSDLFDAEPTYNSKSAQANPKTVFTGFEKIQIAVRTLDVFIIILKLNIKISGRHKRVAANGHLDVNLRTVVH